MKLLKGHEFHGPDGQGYRLMQDVGTGDAILAVQFEAFGGAPTPAPHHPLPHWLEDEIEKACHIVKPPYGSDAASKYAGAA